MTFSRALTLCAAWMCVGGVVAAQEPERQEGERQEALDAMKQAATFYRERVAAHGGYVYYYSPDFSRRLGEGVATADQIWVQPPGTPTVGMALLAAWKATDDPYYLDSAREAAHALIFGQLKSGGWTNSIDFSPGGDRAAAYRNGKGRGKNNSTLDDGISQSAIRFLMQFDEANGFKEEEVHEAVEVALDALLAAQFPNGGFPQVWTGPSADQPVVNASYPDYDWRTENRVKEYWTLYTLNDDLASYTAELLIDADRIYGEPRFSRALRNLGDFLVLAQMPEPQPAWAQQYDYAMRPAWARRFEPPAITGRESQDAIAVLLTVYDQTGDEKYLEPIPRALAYLERSLLPDGRLARYYELETNRPLYMNRDYQLTHDDGDAPSHYGWKAKSRLVKLKREHAARLRSEPPPARAPSAQRLRTTVAVILNELDLQGRWLSTYGGESLVGQPKFQAGEQYISSEVFSRNLTTLSLFVAGESPAP